MIQRIFSVTTALTLLALMMASLSTFAQFNSREVEFKDIIVEDATSAKKRFGSVFAMGASLSEIDEIIRFLFKTNHYDMVEAREVKRNGKSVLQLVGFPVEIIEKVSVTGNDSVSDNDIIEKLELKSVERLPKNQILQLVPAVEVMYRQKGFLSAKVSVEFKPTKSKKIEVLVKVIENLATEIEAISIETSNPSLKSKVQNLVKGYIGDALTSNTAGDVRQEILEFFVEERFLNANVAEPELKYSSDKTKVNIKINIENPYQYFIIYEGNKFEDSIRLSRALKLSSAERFGLNPSAELADRLRVHYQKSGFANAKVTYDEQILPREYVKKLKLKIEEGPRVRIEEIEVGGKISRDSDYYAKFIKGHSSDLISLGYYNLDDLEMGYKNLVTDLQNQGYLQAKLQSARTEFLQNGQFVNVKVFIDEGPQTRIREIKFKGIKALREEELLEIVGLQRGDALSLNIFEASIPKIKDYYMSKGYLDISINEDSTNFIRYNELNTEAAIEYDIQEGPEVEVASILIQGIEQTQEDVILREIDFRAGDILTSARINESEFRLQRLGLFSSVQIRTLEANTSVVKRTAIIEVSERNPGLFNIGGTVNNENIGGSVDDNFGDYFGISLQGYSGIGYRNLFGTARAISLRGEANYNLKMEFTEYDITASYLEPFLFNERLRGRVNFSKNVRVFKITRDPKNPDPELKEQIQALETNQVATSVERDLSRTLKLTWNSWSLANTRKYSIRGRYNEGKDQTLNIATIGPQLDWDLRDNPLSATRGIFVRLTGDYSNPVLGSTDTVDFYKFHGMLNTYLPLGSSRWVWANSFRTGYLKNLSTKPNGVVPEEVMFSMGGRSTNRGFAPLTIPDRRDFINKVGGLGQDAPLFVRHDSHFFLIKTEIRFPFWGDFGGVLFYDGSSVLISGVNFDDSYRDAVGFGFRYNTPVGPVSAELAYPLDKRSDEKTPMFWFSIGAF